LLQLLHGEERGDIVLFWCQKTMLVARLNFESKVSLRFEEFMGDFNPIEVLKIYDFLFGIWVIFKVQDSYVIGDGIFASVNECH